MEFKLAEKFKDNYAKTILDYSKNAYPEIFENSKDIPDGLFLIVKLEYIAGAYENKHVSKNAMKKNTFRNPL